MLFIFGRWDCYFHNKVRYMVLMLKDVINVPTIIINVRVGSFLQVYAASGAARVPPAIKPMIICQCVSPIVVVKVATSVIVTKNSARLTEPMASLGSFPFATRVDVTIGPHPPPPIASRNPPNRPSGKSLVFMFLLLDFFSAFWIIVIPIMSR